MRTSSTSACAARTLRDPRAPPIATTSTFLGPSSPRSQDAPRSNDQHERVELRSSRFAGLAIRAFPQARFAPPQPFRSHRRGRGARIRRVSEEEFDGCGEQTHPAADRASIAQSPGYNDAAGSWSATTSKPRTTKGSSNPRALIWHRSVHRINQPDRVLGCLLRERVSYRRIEVSRHGRSRRLDECARDRVNAVASGFLGDVESAVGLSHQIVGFDGVGGKHRDPEAGGNRADT